MKFITAVLPVLCAGLASSRSFVGASSQDAMIQGAFPVPGDQPLEFCQDPKDYILSVDYVNLSPNPPVPGQKLTISANGTFKSTVEEGATVHLQVKYGLITLIKQQADLCENLPKIDLECPLEKGTLSLVKEVDLPKAIPPGRYNVVADVKSVDGEDITCMMAAISFGSR